MPEIYTCTTPQHMDPGATVFRIAALMLDWANARITVYLRAWDGTQFKSKSITVEYADAAATTMMRSLNKANLSANSLHQRILTQLTADGYLPAGTPGGSVD